LADIFQEVDEDLKHEQFLRLWKRYGSYVLVLAVLIVAATAGYVVWNQHRMAKRMAEGNAFAAAMNLADADRLGDAASAFADVAAKSSGGYASLARLRQAALLARQGDAAGAVKVYDALASSGADKIIRDLASLQSIALSLETVDPGELKARLKPLIDNSTWRYSALELSALLAVRTGDKEHAREILAELKDDAGAPSGVRSRAAEMFDALAK
jgi:hypothetical protein